MGKDVAHLKFYQTKHGIWYFKVKHVSFDIYDFIMRVFF